MLLQYVYHYGVFQLLFTPLSTLDCLVSCGVSGGSSGEGVGAAGFGYPEAGVEPMPAGLLVARRLGETKVSDSVRFLGWYGFLAVADAPPLSFDGQEDCEGRAFSQL